MHPLIRYTVSCLLIASFSLSLQAATIFISKNGKDTSSGLEASTALASVNKGLAIAVAQGGGEIRVAVGKYNEAPLTLPAGITISGGWDNTFEENNRTVFDKSKKLPQRFDEKICDNHTCLTTTQGPHVVSTMSSAGDKPRTLSQLVIIGPDCSLPNSNCDSSFGAIIDQPNVNLDYVVIKAGKGNTGSKGGDGQPGRGTCTKGGLGGRAEHSYGSVFTSCKDNIGDHGETAKLDSMDVALGGKGGESGESSCSSPKLRSEDGEAGKQGEAGQPGVTGRSGLASSIIPIALTISENSLTLQKSISGNGMSGSAGGGGGGGGSGGAWSYWFLGCSTGYQTAGGNGRIGNPGGCPGSGGIGGTSGGGAFALVINNTNVMSEGIALLGGQGGTGGAGGNGALGSEGNKNDTLGQIGSKVGERHTWDCFWVDSLVQSELRGGTGGAGGHGGDGGDGGGGAGGNGGPAVALVKMGKNSLLEIKGGADYIISGGRGGVGGSGGKNGRCIKDSSTCKIAGSGDSSPSYILSPNSPKRVSNPTEDYNSTLFYTDNSGSEGITKESIELP